MNGIPPSSSSQRSTSSYELSYFKGTQSSVNLQQQSSLTERVGPSVPWRTGVLTRFPSWGFGSWFLSLLSTVAGILILVLSNGVPVDNWNSLLQPTVWLALTSTLTAALLAHAFTEAAVITWWRKATGPTSLQELHDSYESSHNLFIACWNLFRWRTKMIGLASIIMTLSAFRGPLMQRASSTANTFKITSGTIDLRIAQELPEDYGAILTGRTRDVSLLTRNFSDVAQGYSNRDSMTILGTTCDNCTTNVKSFGFKTNCSVSRREFDLDISGGDFGSAMNGAYLFQVNITEYREPETVLSKDGSFIRLTTLFKETSGCKDDLSIQTCDLHGGITKVPIRINGGEVALTGTWKDDEFIETKYMLPLGSKDANLLGGFTTVLSSIYGSSAWMHFAGARGWNIVTQGLPSTQYMIQNGSLPSCADKWSNPMDDLIEVARELGFRASLKYGQTNNSDAQQVEYESGVTVLVYVTDYSKMAVAIVVSLVGIMVILPVFWGWWELGRSVTMNPLEIASAFERMSSEGSIFNGTDPNGDASHIAKDASTIGKIQYGAFDGQDGARLGFARAGTIRKPGNGERFVY